jgi:hypothetical protein
VLRATVLSSSAEEPEVGNPDDAERMAQQLFDKLEEESCATKCEACSTFMDAACLGQCSSCGAKVCIACLSEPLDDGFVEQARCAKCSMGSSIGSWVAVSGLASHTASSDRGVVDDNDSDGTKDSGVSSSTSESSQECNDVEVVNNDGVEHKSTAPAKSADGQLWLNTRSGKMHLGSAKGSDRVACGCSKVSHYILLDMAKALCEAGWNDMGIKSKCRTCFGVDGDFLHVAVDVEGASARVATAFELDDDMALEGLVRSMC